MHHRPKVMPPIVYPTKCCVQHYHDTTIVPHIHPSHTTHVNHHMYQHNHYFPHTESVVNEVSNQQFICPPGPGVPPFPGPGAAPFPGQGPAAAPFPGSGMSPAPGMFPGNNMNMG